jgi:hypothetical protein
LCRRCSHGSCRQIAHLSAHGAQRAVPVEFVHEHHFGMRNSRRLRPHLGRNPGRLTTNNAQGGGDITKTSRFRWLCRLLTDGVQPPSNCPARSDHAKGRASSRPFHVGACGNAGSAVGKRFELSGSECPIAVEHVHSEGSATSLADKGSDLSRRRCRRHDVRLGADIGWPRPVQFATWPQSATQAPE